MRKLLTLTTACAMMAAMTMQAQTHEMTVQMKKVGAPIQNTMYGLFFEDINFAADGGLYAELVLNRSFEFPQQLYGWKTVGNVQVRNDGPFERNPHYVRMAYTGHKDKFTVMENSGTFGMGLKEGAFRRAGSCRCIRPPRRWCCAVPSRWPRIRFPRSSCTSTGKTSAPRSAAGAWPARCACRRGCWNTGWNRRSSTASKSGRAL